MLGPNYNTTVNLSEQNGELVIDSISGTSSTTQAVSFINNPLASITSVSFLSGKQGDPGDPGIQGNPGYTPVKGTDYFDGADGPPNTLSIGTVTSGATPSATITGTSPNQVLNLALQTGNLGNTGTGISTIAKTSTAGLTDTYTITYTDATTSTFTVNNGSNGSNGVGITSITKTGTVGLVDTYTITYTNSTTATFTVTNGATGRNPLTVSATAPSSPLEGDLWYQP